MFFDDIDKLIKYLSGVPLKEKEEWWISVAANSRSDIPGLITALNYRKLNIYGCIVPGILWDGEMMPTGFLAINLKVFSKPIVVSNIEPAIVIKLKEDLESLVKSGLPQSLLVLVDGYGVTLDHFLASLVSITGDRFNVFGGGTGVSGEQEASIFTSAGLLRNAALIFPISGNTSIGLRHGFQRVATPLTVTKARQNVLIEIDYQNAFRVYQNLLDEHLKIQIPMYSFSEIAPDYPLGIYRDTSEDLIRDLIAVTSTGEIICSAEIPENIFVGLLQGEERNFIEAEEEALRESVDTPFPPKQMFIFDCILRRKMLGQNYSREIKRIFELSENLVPDANLAGILTLGQIALSESDRLDYYNKSISIASIYD